MEPVEDVINSEDAVKTDIDRKPIGDVILGSIDPRTLTREDFELSPDVLLHGTHNPFEFNPDFDYEDADYQDQDYGTSMTLGVGFHATSARDAEDYAFVRASYASMSIPTAPYVAKLLPFQARCLDMRLASDPTQNAPVPVEFVNQWRAFFEMSRLKPNRFEGVDSPRVREHLVDMESRYALWLSNEGRSIDIQGLLDGNMRSPWPPWMATFREFMLSVGYDGLIANQGSERHSDKFNTTYVFYNLHKIGTYDSWKKTDDTSPADTQSGSHLD